MPKLTINNQEIEVPAGITVLQACELAGVEIPRFCYHDKLKIAGNCRMCLVEMEKAPKPVASCAMPAADGMNIKTNSKLVKKAREGVMEFMLINHPLDCPICDQGGECDLQDQAYAYGKSCSQYDEQKRAVADKNMGPLIKTHMTRCIHCTRCVRFATDVAGVKELGAIGRGEHTEITTYLEKTLDSELSGNVIDLCPVGALTSKPYAFKARSWELKKTESIDVHDAMGASIRIDSRNMEVMRILPMRNDEINEEWLSDKSRFAYDGLKNQRLDKPYLKENGKFKAISWQQAYEVILNKFKEVEPREIAAIAGQFTDCETMYSMKKLLNQLNCYNHDFNQFDYYYDKSSRGNYLFNSSIQNIDQADLVLLIGANPRLAAPVLNARIRANIVDRDLAVARIGEKADLTYQVEELGNNVDVLKEIIDNKHQFADKLKKAKRPMIIVGDGVYKNDQAQDIFSIISDFIEKFNIVNDEWHGFNLLNNHAANIGALEVGFTDSRSRMSVAKLLAKAEKQEVKLLYLLGADEIDLTNIQNSFIIYQGHHGDKSANFADLILPAAAYTEKSATYINLEGRVQRTTQAVKKPGEALDDYQIIMNIAQKLKIDLEYTDLSSLRAEMAKKHSIFKKMNIANSGKVDFKQKSELEYNIKLIQPSYNFYMTNSIARASKTMAECVKARMKLSKVA